MTKYRELRAPTVESIHAIDYSRRLELFMILSAADVVALYGDKKSHEEASERISTNNG